MTSSGAWLRVAFWAVGIVAVLLVLDRLLLAAEARGWIYWRRRRASPGTLGNAVASMHALLEPDRRHLAEERRAVRREEEDEDGPPETGKPDGTGGASQGSNH